MAAETDDCETSDCGDEGNRTPNPRLAKAVLCQLSYVPEDPAAGAGFPSGATWTRTRDLFVISEAL